MSSPLVARVASAFVLASVLGCSSKKIGDDADEPSPSTDQSKSLELTVDPDLRRFVDLATPALLDDVAGAGATSLAWDLAFQGRDVFVNGGVSGPGNASAFGPLSSPTFLSDTAPDVPLLLQDRAGGALLDWYKYAGATHRLFSRYHVYGIKDADRLYKLQIISYYGDELGAPVSALYHVRYAEVTPDAVLSTHDVDHIDATAGGTAEDPSQPSACLDLDSERTTALTPAEAAASNDWQLCFRREGVLVNGGLSGPRGMQAVDLQGAQTADETEAEIEQRTATSEEDAFDRVDAAVLGDPALAYAADGVVTAFGRRWLQAGSDPLELSDSAWLVIGVNGGTKYLLEFNQLTGDPGAESVTVGFDVKSVK